MRFALPPDKHRLFIVIPAKAGIHFSTFAVAAWWIPAFAGMTV
jgi:hypothetical protein